MRPTDLPDFKATWWPVSMETVPGSGEAVNVAVIVRARTGQAAIRQIIDPPALTAMFGADNGKGLHWMIDTMVQYAQAALAAGTKVEELQFVMGGFTRLRGRACQTRDMAEAFDLAISMCSGFVTSNFGRRQGAGETSRAAFQDWAAGVRDVLLDRPVTKLQAANFDVRLKLPRKTVVYGFVHNHYAANFGVLRPGHAANDLRSLKVKVFDLETLHHEQPITVEKVEVLLGCPPHDALASFSRREVDSFHDTLAYITNEAAVRDVELVRCARHEDAANHIQKALAA